MNDTPPLDLLVQAEPAPAPAPPPFVPGVFADMPNDTYHAIDCLSSSGAKTIVNRSLAHYRYERENPREPTDAMRLGTVTHTAILEPDKLDALVLIRPDEIDARTKDGKAALAALNAQAAAEKRMLVKQSDYDRVLRMRDAVHRHPGAQRLLAGAQREVSYFWNDASTQAPLKCRPDILQRFGDDLGLSDIKTCSDASPAGFGRQIAAFDYHLSASFYFSGMEHVEHRTPLFFAFIAVESEAPHGVGVYTLTPDALLAGARKANRAIVAYAEARRTGYWRSYSTLIEPAQLPAWALREPF